MVVARCEGAGMQQHPSVAPTAPPPGYGYAWPPPGAPVLRVYDRLTTQLLRHDTLTALDLLRCPGVATNKAGPHHHNYWPHKARFPQNYTGGYVRPLRAGRTLAAAGTGSAGRESAPRLKYH